MKEMRVIGHVTTPGGQHLQVVTAPNPATCSGCAFAKRLPRECSVKNHGELTCEYPLWKNVSHVVFTPSLEELIATMVANKLTGYI